LKPCDIRRKCVTTNMASRSGQKTVVNNDGLPWN